MTSASYYEALFLIRPDVSASQVQVISARYQDLVKSSDGKVFREEYCGFRSMAYKIKKKKKSHYLLLEIHISKEALEKFQYTIRYDEDILRVLVVRIDQPSTGPSVLSQGWNTQREWTGNQERREGPSAALAPAVVPESGA